MNTILIVVVALLAGAGGGFLLSLLGQKKSGTEARAIKEQALEEAKKKADEVLSEAQKKAHALTDQAKAEERERRQQLDKTEGRLLKKEELLDEKSEKVEGLKAKLEERVEEIKAKQEAIQKLEVEGQQNLERIAGLSGEEAKNILLTKYETEFSEDIFKHVQKVQEAALEESDRKAKKVIALAIQKYASEVATENTSTVVELPSDELKGRIIGREGRNINAFELHTGTDVIVDDTPGSILISGFDLMRRYVAKRSIEELISDGRIHPTRIEEVVERVREETNQLVKEFGEKAALELGLSGIHPNLMKLMGRLRFRTSYSQNILKHSIEVAYLAAHLAGEIGADIHTAKLGGFLHDIGKAVTHEIEGTHAIIGANILRKFSMPVKIINCVEAHHDEVEKECIEAILVAAADAISGARPGARRDSLDNYIKRLTELENVATGFSGVKKAFAIQAGREIRIMVDPEEVDDLGALRLSREITMKIESDLQYPGIIKVHVIREKRIVDYAK